MCEWLRLRSSLNHDWLKNDYLKNLDSLIVRLQTTKAVDAELGKEMRAYLCAWESRHSEMEKLLSTAEDRLSPRSLFDKEPLIHCLPEHRRWLEPLIHNLWLFHYGVSEKVAEARGLFSEADQSHGHLVAEFKHGGTQTSITTALEAFTDLVKQLSRLLSSFPDKVVTV